MASALKSARTSSGILRAAVLAAVGATLAWQVISRSLVAYLGVVAPETALVLRATEPTALLNLADSGLMGLDLDRSAESGAGSGARNQKRAVQGGSEAPEQAGGRLRVWAELAKSIGKSRQVERASGLAKSPAEPAGGASGVVRTKDEVRGWAELALASDPLNPRALRILGQLADAAGDHAEASTLMRTAARLSIRESVAVYWLMRKSYENGDYATTVANADVLLRTRSEALKFVMPILAQMSENKDANGELKKLLAGNPPWRAQFFSAFPRSVADARAPLDLLLAVRDTPTPPTAADLRAYLDVLIGHKYYELAYYVWLQFLETAQLRSIGLLFNGSFEAAPSGLPFDWVIRSGAGVTVDILERPDQDGQHALFVEFGQGRVEFQGVAQLVMLAPGTYRFKGKYRGELVGRRGLVWRVTCAGGTSVPIGESAMTTGAAPLWRDIEFSFTVPDANCRAQQLRLELDARMASEQLVSGSIWYDELRIVRVD
jgi:hypothetical protein